MAQKVQTGEESDGKESDTRPKRISVKWQRIIKYSILFLCVAGLIVQVTDLIMQFKKRRTVVHLDFETLWYNRLPAITICYPHFISMSKAVEKFPNLKTDYQEYKNILNEVKDNDFNNKQLQTRLHLIYSKFLDKVHQNNLTFEEWSELGPSFYYPPKYSPAILRILKIKPTETTTRPIDVKLEGLRRNETDGSISPETVEDWKPIESVVHDSEAMLKCFTFFSHLQKPMREYQMNIKSIDITVRHHWDWWPPTLYEAPNTKILFAMHSSNGIPQNWDTFMELRTNWWYEIRYNRWKTILLGPPYKTNCIDYDMDNAYGFKIRSDCINHCITEELDRQCLNCDHRMNNSECEPCFLRSDYLWRVETARLDQNIDRRFCNTNHEDNELTDFEKCIHFIREKVSHQCQSKCQPECLNRYYNFVVFSKEPLLKGHKLSANNWDVETKIYIGHSHLPDQIAQHIEEMSVVTFAGILGGLLGVWMGLSTLAILHFTLKLV